MVKKMVSFDTNSGKLAADAETRILAMMRDSWQNLTLGANVTNVPTHAGSNAPGFSPLSARLEGTDVVRLRGSAVRASPATTAGTIDTTTGQVTAGTVVATVPTALKPSKVRVLGVTPGSSGASRLVVDLNGDIWSYGGTIGANTLIMLDGLIYTM